MRRDPRLTLIGEGGKVTRGKKGGDFLGCGGRDNAERKDGEKKFAQEKKKGSSLLLTGAGGRKDTLKGSNRRADSIGLRNKKESVRGNRIVGR